MAWALMVKYRSEGSVLGHGWDELKERPMVVTREGMVSISLPGRLLMVPTTQIIVLDMWEETDGSESGGVAHGADDGRPGCSGTG